MKRGKVRKISFTTVLILLLLISLGVFAVVFVNSELGKKTKLGAKADGPEYVLEASITDPPLNTILHAGTRSQVTLTMGEHTYPIQRVVFDFSGKRLCEITEPPYVCNYRVPYTGSGSHVPKGSKSGIALTIHIWDVAGHVRVETMQLWSYK